MTLLSTYKQYSEAVLIIIIIIGIILIIIVIIIVTLLSTYTCTLLANLIIIIIIGIIIITIIVTLLSTYKQYSSRPTHNHHHCRYYRFPHNCHKRGVDKNCWEKEKVAMDKVKGTGHG